MEPLETGQLPACDTGDPFDACGVVLRITAGSGGKEAEEFADRLCGTYLRRAREQGWRVVELDGEREGGRFAECTMAITGGGGGPGVWARLKDETGVHQLSGAATEGRHRRRPVTAYVLVLPDSDRAPCPADHELRLDLLCDRKPPFRSNLRVTHLPTGTTAFGVAPHPREAKVNALRVIRAQLLAAGEGLGAPGPYERPVCLHRGLP